jgi:hypothetical protein
MGHGLMAHGSIRPRRGAQRKPLGVDLFGQRQERSGQAGELAGVGRPRRPLAPTERWGATCPVLGGGAALAATGAPLVAGPGVLAVRAQERLGVVARSMRCRRGPVEPTGSHSGPPGPAPISSPCP